MNIAQPKSDTRTRRQIPSFVVLDDADVDAVNPGAASAIFFNHGRCCCAGSRLMVHQKIFDKVVAGVADQAKRIKVGPGLVL